jgi:hypothetical protein
MPFSSRLSSRLSLLFSLLPWLLLISVGAGCHSTPPDRESLLIGFAGEFSALERALAGVPPSAPEALRFSLAFGAEADLDLFVTGPLYESVYFANTPSKTGGFLEVDLRCESPAPRIESVQYADPLSGHYRVSIDFPRRCDDSEASVPFAVSVQRGGETPLASANGVIYPGEFLTIVLETEIR